jgi:hypothetical protein
MRTRSNVKKSSSQKKRIFSKKHYLSGDGMLTGIWGPNLWHYLHTISFNYPNKPTPQDKKYYKQFVLNLQHTLPCKYCRINLKNNFKVLPLSSCFLKDRTHFSRYIYNLHELVNKMLNKKSGLTYTEVRDRYEHFRSRCNKKNKTDKDKLSKTSIRKSTKKNKKEKGCVDPLYGKKSKCIINIVPQYQKGKTLKIDNKCLVGGKPPDPDSLS